MKRGMIIEGFWDCGKTATINFLKDRIGCEVIPEPLHRHIDLENRREINQWYLEKHLERQEKFCGDSCKAGCIMERSVMSSIAFNYASGIDLEDEEDLMLNLQNCHKRKKFSMVYLYAPLEYLKEHTEVIDDKFIKKLHRTRGFLERYHYFYTHVLPLKYEIPPLALNILDKEGIRRSAQDIGMDIISALDEDRIAQINVVCFRQVEGTNEYLVLKRNEEKGGFWQTVTGGIGVMENIYSAVRREVQEELNVYSKDIIDISPANFTFSYIGSEGYELHEYVFGCQLRESADIAISKEHTAHEWLSKEEATKRVKYEGNKQAILEI